MRLVKIIFWLIVASVIILATVLILDTPNVGYAIGTNINSSATSSVAYDDVSGWWDFYNTGNVMVYGTRIEGYASSSLGDISLDCATTRSGNICDSSNYGICNGPGPHSTDGTCANGDASGSLTGWGWNDTIGWISFNCDQSSHGGSDDCASSNYSVVINQDTGDFSGYAWSEVDGWISFNCENNGGCEASNYKLNTAWRATSTTGYIISSTFDTGITNGATLSSLIWDGNSPSETCVKFQVAASNSSGGPWNFKGPSGDDATYYGAPCSQKITGQDICSTKDTPICVDSSQFNNYRYYRYKAFLSTNRLQTETPRIDDVILNFSK